MRPGNLRMKDSDDYLTARAANPRTGLISPSLGSRTPGSNRNTLTPQSPGEALKLRSLEQDESPTTRYGHVQSRANEGRKLSGGHHIPSEEPQIWHHNSAQQSGEGGTRASKRPGLVREDKALSGLHPDQFVVHMSSAEEPQPFAYPGYSSEQIEALEHYRCKSRRVSSDGYDRRLQNATKPHVCTCRSAEFEYCTNSDVLNVCACPRGYFQSYQGARTNPPTGGDPPAIAVRKRRGGSGGHVRVDVGRGHPPSGLSVPASGENTVVASTVATRSGDYCIPQTVPGAFPSLATGKPCYGQMGTAAPRKQSIDKAHVLSHDKHHHHEHPSGVYWHRKSSSDLAKMLPPVSLIRPELAAVPGAKDALEAKYHATNQSIERTCSLGCQRNPSTGQCTGRRAQSQAMIPVDLRSASCPSIKPVISPPGLLFVTLFPPQYLAQAQGFLLHLATSTLHYLHDIHPPESNVLEVISSPTTSVKDKVAALKSALSLGGHVLAICVSLVVAWKLGEAVMRVVEVLAWPLVVPLRVLGWVVGGV